MIYGIIFGLGLAFVIGIISYILGMDALWLSIGLGIGAVFVMAAILYFSIFRPTEKKAAERIDRLGLEERLITMLQFEDDNSAIAKIQREDAKEKLSKISRKFIKVKISSTVIALIAVLAVFVSFTTTISSLSARGMMDYLPGLDKNTGIGSREMFTVTYKVVGLTAEGVLIEGDDIAGFIEGGEIQFIPRDEDANTVVAIAHEGWFFGLWIEDESLDAERTDTRIQGNMTFTALFIELSTDGTVPPGDPPIDPPIDPIPPVPPGDPPIDPEEKPPIDDDNKGGGKGGQYDPNYQVIDGETYYREVIKQFYDEAMAILAEGGELTPLQIAIIEAYRKIIE